MQNRPKDLRDQQRFDPEVLLDVLRIHPVAVIGAMIYDNFYGAPMKESYDETLPSVSLDADQIKQVFLNMMTNAIQAIPEGGELKVVTAYRPQAES